jgi:hypothetical protein
MSWSMWANQSAIAVGECRKYSTGIARRFIQRSGSHGANELEYFRIFWTLDLLFFAVQRGTFHPRPALLCRETELHVCWPSSTPDPFRVFTRLLAKP